MEQNAAAEISKSLELIKARTLGGRATMLGENAARNLGGKAKKQR